MSIVPMTTLLSDTAVSAPCACVRLMCWNVVSRIAADTDGIGLGDALVERSLR